MFERIPESVVLTVILPEVGRVLCDAIVIVAAPPVRVVKEAVRLADLHELVLDARGAVFVRVPLTSQTLVSLKLINFVIQKINSNVYFYEIIVFISF